jgi:signal transduction histidine kinase
MDSKRRTVVLLRWVLIIAFSYLLILDSGPATVRPHVVVLIAVVLASNLLLGRLPERWTDSKLLDFAIVMFDAAWVTWGLIWAPNVSGDLFLLYFLVIFVAAVGESLPTIVGSAAVVSLVYGYTVSTQTGTAFQLTTGVLLRVPFLFVVALFYGYFVSEIRGRRSEATEARLRDLAKSELLAAVSHDLRAPLGNAQSLLDLALDPEHGSVPDRNLVLRAQVNIQRVLSLVSNLLQTASIKNGGIRLQLAPTNLNEIVEDALHLHAPATTVNEIEVVRALDPQMPVIFADSVQVGRIVGNLFDNAVKYGGKRGRLRIATGHDERNVYVSVSDSGPGMSPEQCKELFAPYRRVHIGGHAAGSGLGLYIVRRLVEAMGGTVDVESQPGSGSTFKVTLPYENTHPASAARKAALPVRVVAELQHRAA